MECYECGRTDGFIRVCDTHNPKHACVCKDCCISRLNGHNCRWFELCWHGTGEQG